MRLSHLHPALFHLRVGQLRWKRRVNDRIQKVDFARGNAAAPYEHTAKRHQSLLRRKLGDSDPRLQENKVTNLAIAIATMDGLVIGPGETFSFWECVGPPTAQRGYIEGLQLSRGEVTTGIGGGLCQLANLLYWIALHTPLKVVERHHHSFDPFPDSHRVLPFGSGAGVFYNYVDLRFHNPTELNYHLKLWLTDKHLKGLITSEQEWPNTYKVHEKKHAFLRRGKKTFRTNELWRRVIDRRTGDTVCEEFLMKNFAEVKYEVDESMISAAGVASHYKDD
jgi:vancomycin resistance protein VanW